MVDVACRIGEGAIADGQLDVLGGQAAHGSELKPVSPLADLAQIEHIPLGQLVALEGNQDIVGSQPDWDFAEAQLQSGCLTRFERTQGVHPCDLHRRRLGVDGQAALIARLQVEVTKGVLELAGIDAHHMIAARSNASGGLQANGVLG